MTIRPYTFDTKMWANVTVVAKSEEQAAKLVNAILESMDVSGAFLDGFNDQLKADGKTDAWAVCSSLESEGEPDIETFDCPEHEARPDGRCRNCGIQMGEG